VKIIDFNGYPNGYVKGHGPACTPGARCACGAAAVLQCQGCGSDECIPCFNRNKHPRSFRVEVDGPFPFANHKEGSAA